jgi:hypothetical protein
MRTQTSRLEHQVPYTDTGLLSAHCYLMMLITRTHYTNFCFMLFIDKTFVIFEAFLDMYLELDNVAKNLFDLGVQFFTSLCDLPA